jgi:hypothetical protein
MRSPQWSKASQDYFLNEIIRLQTYIGGRQRNEFPTLNFPSLENLERPLLALEQLTYTLDLNPYEWAFLLFCAAWSTTSHLKKQCETYFGQPLHQPTRDIALSLFGGGYSLCAPNSPLFEWRLIHEGSGDLCDSPLVIDNWVLQYILGFDAPSSQFTSSQLPKAFPYSDGDILASSQATILYHRTLDK